MRIEKTRSPTCLFFADSLSTTVRQLSHKAHRPLVVSRHLSHINFSIHFPINVTTHRTFKLFISRLSVALNWEALRTDMAVPCVRRHCAGI